MKLNGASGYLLMEDAAKNSVCTDEELLLCGPAGTSKTCAACAWLVYACQKYPGSQHLLCRERRSSMTDTTLVTLESVIGSANPEVTRTAREQRHSYRLWGSEIVCAGLDEPSKAFGSAWGRIVFEEAIEGSLETWELFGRAARDPKYRRAGEAAGTCPHQRLAVTNPGDPGHWLNRRATREPPSTSVITYDDWERLYAYSTGPQDGKMRRLLSVHQDNPIFFDVATWTWTEKGKKYLESLAMMSGFRRAHAGGAMGDGIGGSSVRRGGMRLDAAGDGASRTGVAGRDQGRQLLREVAPITPIGCVFRFHSFQEAGHGRKLWSSAGQ